MAYSTQIIFFHVPFMNEKYGFQCDDSCVKLKSYQSSFDDRSWAATDRVKSRFIVDLVACKPVPKPPNDSESEAEDERKESNKSRKQSGRKMENKKDSSKSRNKSEEDKQSTQKEE
ncbi:hypothetical protein KR222_009080 [Zaprionus bogoriensis]|nr:hypothetical protein KR222_009080 [Zaprionus bogoriensis]